MSVDDLPVEQYDSLHDLCVQLSAGETVKRPVWNGSFNPLPILLQYYGPYAQTTLFRGRWNLFRPLVSRTLFCGFPSSTYPSYVRRMNGQGPVQAPSAFQRPRSARAKLAVNCVAGTLVRPVNDLFSFCKESGSAFERINYPLNEAACTERSVLDILTDLVNTATGRGSGYGRSWRQWGIRGCLIASANSAKDESGSTFTAAGIKSGWFAQSQEIESCCAFTR
ncbi:hypothetical protein BDW67DRAFT_161472 [Aspergillus spinulosporus]